MKEVEGREAGPTGDAGHSVSDNPEVLSCKGYLKTGFAKDTLNFSWGGGGKLRRDRMAKTRRLIRVYPLCYASSNFTFIQQKSENDSIKYFMVNLHERGFLIYGLFLISITTSKLIIFCFLDGIILMSIQTCVSSRWF